MIWQNPWAFAGLAAVAIPILIHLLSRRNTRREPFPTLRFLPASQSAPVRFTRITDPVLMVVRALIVGAAVAALAQPLWQTAERRAATERQIVRAIVLDTSASMRSSADSARRTAAAIASDASANLLIETAHPADVLQGASSWLQGQTGRREIVVVSDFQAGVLDSVDLRSVGADVALRFERVPASAIRLDSARSGGIALLTAPASRANADAALRAAAPVSFDTSAYSVAIVYPDAAERASLLSEAGPVTDARIADALVRMRRDPLLDAAMPASLGQADTSGIKAPFTRISRVERSGAAVHAALARRNGRETLLLFTSFSAGTLQSAALIGSIARALAPAVPPDESEPAVIPDVTLATWARTAPVHHAIQGEIQNDSDARWVWLLVLLLLVAETLVRRRNGDAQNVEAAHAG